MKTNFPRLYRPLAVVWKGLSIWLYTLVLKRPKTWFWSKALLTGGPTAFLSFATLKLPALAEHQTPLLEWLGAHIWAVMVVLAWPIVAQGFFSFLEWFMDPVRTALQSERERFVTLYTAMEEVVGRKCKRCGDYAHRLRTRASNAPGTRAAAMDAILAPGDQIEHLVEAAFDVLNTLLRGKKNVEDQVKVVLVDIDKGQPAVVRVHLPTNATPRASMLGIDNVRKTLWARAAQSGKTLVIEDIEHHLSAKGPKEKIYLPSTEPGADVGSIAAVPIIHPSNDTAVFVLSFKSPSPGRITEEFIKDIRPVILAFTNRLLLEHHIEFIKKHTYGRG